MTIKTGTLTDIILLAMAATAIFLRYQAVKLPFPTIPTTYTVSDRLLETPKIYGNRQYFKLGQVRIVTSVPPMYQFGDYLTVTGQLDNTGQIRFPKVTIDDKVSNYPLKSFVNLRQTLSNIIGRYLPTPEAELVAGVIWGQKAALPKEFSDNLKVTGVMHVVVVSGYNIALLIAVILPLSRFFGRSISVFLTFFVIIGFILLAGAEAPAIRAGIMGSLTIVSDYFGRQKTALRLLLLAGTGMLLSNPLFIEELGFQLSFMATLGLILFGNSKRDEKEKKEKVGKKKPETDGFWEFIKAELRTTVAAQVLVLPLLALAFSQISLVSPLTNVLISPLIGPLMAGGLLLTCLGAFSSLLGGVLGVFVALPSGVFVAIVNLLARAPGVVVTVTVGPKEVVLYYLIVVVVLVYRGIRRAAPLGRLTNAGS